MAITTETEAPDIVDVSPRMLKEWVDDGDVVVVDVREDFEHATERIPGSFNFAISQFDPDAIRDVHGTHRVVFHCGGGGRSSQAALQYRAGDENVYHLAGGLKAWKASGYETRRSESAPRIDVMRQVQITVGLLVLVGVLLGAFVTPWFLILSGAVGAGLVFAGASGWCGMAMLLGRMPWNRVR